MSKKEIHIKLFISTIYLEQWNVLTCLFLIEPVCALVVFKQGSIFHKVDADLSAKLILFGPVHIGNWPNRPLGRCN